MMQNQAQFRNKTITVLNYITNANSLLVSNLFYMMTDIDHITNSPRSLLDLGSQVDTSHCDNLHINQIHDITAVHILANNAHKPENQSSSIDMHCIPMLAVYLITILIF